MGSLLLSVFRTPFLAAARLIRICRFAGISRLVGVGLRSHVDFRAVPQLVGTVDYDAIAWRQPGDHLHTLALGHAELDRADRYGAVGINEVDERAGHTALDTRRRHRRDVLVGVDQQPDIDELVRVESFRFVRELRPCLDCSGGRIDLTVEGLQDTVGNFAGSAAIVGNCGQHRAGLHPLQDRLDVVFREREQHADRLQLRDHDETVGVAGRHVVALVHQAQTDTAVQRRNDAAILQVYLGGLDSRAVGFDRALILRDQRDLRIQCLTRHGVLRCQTLVAGQIDLGALQQRFITRQIAVRLGQGSLVWPRSDLREQVALLDVIAFLEIDLHQVTADLGPDGHGRERGYRTEGVEVDPDIALAYDLGHN